MCVNGANVYAGLCVGQIGLCMSVYRLYCGLTIGWRHIKNFPHSSERLWAINKLGLQNSSARYCRYSCTAACRLWTRSVEYTNSGSECTFSHMSLPHPPLNFGRVRVLKGAHLPWQHLFFQLGSTRVRLCVLCVVKFATVYLHPIEHSVIASKCMCVCTMFYVHVSQIFSVHVIDACCTI